MNRPAALLAFLALLICPRLVQAQFPDALGRISDFSGQLDSGSRQKLDRSLKEMRALGISGAVAILPSTSPDSPQQWAQEAMRRWGLTPPEEKSGLLVVLALREQRVEIEVGDGLLSLLPRVHRATTIAREAPTELLQKDWSIRLVALVGALEAHLRGALSRDTEESAPLVEAPPPRRLPPPSGLVALLGDSFLFLLSPWNTPLVLAGFWMIWVFSLPLRRLFFHRRLGWIGVGLLVYVLLASWFLAESQKHLVMALTFLLLGFLVSLYTLSRRCHRCKAGYLDVFSRTLRSSDQQYKGRGETTVSCPRCDYHHVSTYPLPREQSSDLPRGESAPTVGLPSFGGTSSSGAGAGRRY